jgi:hypothetical protein
MKRRTVNLLAPPPTADQVMRVQLALSGVLKIRIQAYMEKYGLEQAAVVRMLLVDGLEARDGRMAS